MRSVHEPERRRWQGFLALWVFAGVALFTIGLIVVFALRHGHRIGAVAVLLGIVCLAIGNLVRLAGRGA